MFPQSHLTHKGIEGPRDTTSQGPAMVQSSLSVPKITRWKWAQLCQHMQQLCIWRNCKHHHGCCMIPHVPEPMNPEHPDSQNTRDNPSAAGVSGRPAAHPDEETGGQGWVSPTFPWRCWETAGPCSDQSGGNVRTPGIPSKHLLRVSPATALPQDWWAHYLYSPNVIL